MNYKNLIDSCNNSKICFDNSVREDTNRGRGFVLKDRYIKYILPA